MLKVLYLPLNAGGTQQGMYDAWNALGVDLEIFDFYNYWLNNGQDINKLHAEFLKKVESFKPDLVSMQLQFTGLLTKEVLFEARKRSPNSLFINWSGDLRKEPPPEFCGLASALDYSLVSNTGQMELYRKAGCTNVCYWQVGYDPKICFPKKLAGSFKYSVSLTANVYTADTFPDAALRLSIARMLKNKYKNKAGIFGAGYGREFGKIKQIPPSQLNDVYNDSVCVLSVSNFNDVSHYFSDRLLASLGSGRPVICYRFPGVESYFVHERDLLIANTPEDICKWVDWCVANPGKANEIGMNGYRKVLSEHTCTSRVLELVYMLGLQGKL